jgi:hypothetical protein
MEIFNMMPKDLVRGSDLSIYDIMQQIMFGDYGKWNGFKVAIDSDCDYWLEGDVKLIGNDFTKMPRGQITFQIDQATSFRRSKG